MTAIYGFAETLRRRGRELAEAQRVQMEEMLYDQVERLSSLVGQLLDLSRLEADAVEIKPQRVALRETLEEIVAAAAPGQSVVVSVEDDSRQEAFVDLDALDRIVSNLVVNALRYGEPPVSVSAGNRSEELHVTVEDRGSGVPLELVPQLFERFARGRPSVERPPGTGLGLAIARSYARAHRGELRYRPATPHGAAFELVLPTPAA